MPFDKALPQWNKTAVAPAQSKMDAGWSANEKPPASIFNWFFNTVYLALQELQQEAINVDQKGVNNGVATLDAAGDVPIGQADNILNWVKGFGLGDVAKTLASGADVNTIDQTGFYYVFSDGVNIPSAHSYWILNMKYSSLHATQLAIRNQASTSIIYQRVKNNGTWSAWTQFATYDATGKVAIANLPAATTAAAGIAQLVDSITDTSTNKAATANSVKLLADWVKGFGLGDVVKSLGDGFDLDNIDATGFYYSLNSPNRPAGINGYVFHQKLSPVYKTQIYTNVTNGFSYQRTNNNGVWSAWAQIATYDATGKVAAANLPAATTSASGIAQLDDTISSTSTTKAATANAVKQVVDWAKSFGLGDVAKDISSTDLNNLDATGIFSGTNLTNSPNTSAGYIVLHYKRSSSIKVQQLLRYSTTAYEVWTRLNNSGTWTAWTQQATYDANGKVATANLPAATTSASGVAQLNDTITSTSTSQAATANAVKQVVDWAKGFGLGDTNKIISNADANTFNETGFYYVGGTATNVPVNGASYYIIHQKYASTYMFQIAMHASNGLMYARYNNAGTWTAWQQMPTIDSTGLLTPATEVKANSIFSLGSNQFEKQLGNFGVTNGTANVKADITIPNTSIHATIDISVVGQWGNGSASGRITKRYMVVLTAGGTINYQKSVYTEVDGLIQSYIALGDLVWDATNSVFKVQIASLSTLGNSYNVSVKAVATNPTYLTSLKSIAMGSTYTTDTTVLPTPVLSDGMTDWVKSFGLGDVAKDISSTDLNALDATGFYRGTNLTNRPTGTTADWFFVINIKHNSNYKMQYALSFNTTAVYVRSSNSSGVWLAWAQQAAYDATGKVATANLPDATTSAKGITQLVDNYTTADATKAATANAVKSLADLVQSPVFTNATLQNSWVNFDATRIAKYAKDAMGYVVIEGYVKSGTVATDTAIFTLPVGYRPAGIEQELVSVSGGYASMRINSTGVVSIETNSASTGGSPQGWTRLHARFFAG